MFFLTLFMELVAIKKLKIGSYQRNRKGDFESMGFPVIFA